MDLLPLYTSNSNQALGESTHLIRGIRANMSGDDSQCRQAGHGVIGTGRQRSRNPEKADSLNACLAIVRINV